MTRIPLWIDLRGIPVNKRLSHLKAIVDAKADAVLLEQGDPHVGKAGLTTVTVGADGQLRRKGKRIGRLLEVNDRESQQTASKAKGIVVADGKGWRVIPLENLLAARREQLGTLYALARSADQARLFAGTLETGVHGVVLAPSSPADIRAADEVLRQAATARRRTGPPVQQTPPADERAIARQSPPAKALHGTGNASHNAPLVTPIQLVIAKVTSVSEGGLGDRVCVDTTSRLRDGEGLLVGSTARSLALVHAETTGSDLLAARPFRVNAGALHSYTLMPGGTTRYLSELGAGDDVLVVATDGSHRTATIGRCKVERRPHTLVKWSAAGANGSVILQTAETVCLVGPDGTRRPVTSLRPGDEILVHPESAARHAGLAIDAAMEER